METAATSRLFAIFVITVMNFFNKNTNMKQTRKSILQLVLPGLLVMAT